MKFPASCALPTALCLLFFTLQSGVFCQEETSCRGAKMNLTEAQRAGVGECLKEAGSSSVWKIPPEKVSCFSLCLLERKGLLTTIRAIDVEKVKEYITNAVADGEARKFLIDGITSCIKKDVEHLGRPGMSDVAALMQGDKDKLCSKFMGVGICIHEVFIEIVANIGRIKI